MTAHLHVDQGWVLVLLWLVPLLAAWWHLLLARRQRALEAFVSAPLQAKLAPAPARRRRIWQFGLVYAGLALALIAAARPRWGLREAPILTLGHDVMICIDVSRSMLARDVHPNRLQRVKADVLDLIRELEGDRAGIVAFRRGASLLCPLTRDSRFLLQIVEGIDIDSAPPGETDIAAAIRKALDAFESRDAGARSILLISDGEALTGDTLAAAEAARDAGIPIFTVGIGSREGATVPGDDGRPLTFEGSPVISRLQHEALHRIAAVSGGTYWPIERAGTAHTTLGTLYRRHLKPRHSREAAEARLPQPVERYQWFLFPAVILLLGAALLSPGRPGSRPARRMSGAARLALLLPALLGLMLAPATRAGTGTAAAPAGRAAARLAQRLHRDGRYHEAAAAYGEAARDAAPRERERYNLNAALALLAAGDHDAAAERLEAVRPDKPQQQARAAAALGAARYRSAAALPDDAAGDAAPERLRLFQDAAEAFRQALRRSDADGEERDTLRSNLAVAMSALPEAERAALDARIRERYGNQDAGTLADLLLQRQRRLQEETAAALALESPDQVTTLEQLALQQRELADVWIPLLERADAELAQRGEPGSRELSEALGNYASQARRHALTAAERLRDLDPSGAAYGDRALQHAYGLWKGMVPHPLLLQEDSRRQEAVNTALAAGDMSGTARQEAIADQREAALLSALFHDRFNRDVPEAGLPGEDGISPETRTAILELADQARQAQEQAADDMAGGNTEAARQQAEAAWERLLQIEKLLPQPPQQQPDGTPDAPPPEQDPSETQPQPAPADTPPDEDPEPSPSPPETVEQGQMEQDFDAERIEQMLDRALEREQEHEADKRRRRRHMPLPPSERDW